MANLNMAAPRLMFLYPRFIRSSLQNVEQTGYRSLCEPSARRRHTPQKGFHTAARNHEQSAYPQRYGSAAEPKLPPPPKPPGNAQPRIGESAGTTEPKESKEVKESKEAKESKEPKEPTPPLTDPRADAAQAHHKSSKEAEDPSSNLSTEPPLREESNPTTNTPLETSRDQKTSAKEEEQNSSPNPIDEVLQMPPPSSRRSSPPHLQAPPYVHHFDTYTLVRDLAKGGFTEAQTITIMKGVRSILGENMDTAQEALISKSDVENETYLFRAACSELRTSLQTSRNAEMQKQRTQRTHLQHEVDMLSQRMTQELMALKDDTRGFFNDRKMAVRMEQREMESKIQELNYKITVGLNSDMRSEAEGLRWVLTRRVAFAIAFVACKSELAINTFLHWA